MKIHLGSWPEKVKDMKYRIWIEGYAKWWLYTSLKKKNMNG